MLKHATENEGILEQSQCAPRKSRLYGVASGDVGMRIKQLRVSLGMSQLSFAAAVGMKSATVSKWETGNCSPSLKSLNKIEREYDVPLYWLLFGQSEPTKIPTLYGVREDKISG